MSNAHLRKENAEDLTPSLDISNAKASPYIEDTVQGESDSWASRMLPFALEEEPHKAVGKD